VRYDENKRKKLVVKEDYHRIESLYGSFTRSFRLPENVNGDKGKGSFKDGMLDIRIPKTEEAKQKKNCYMI
jgi:HSP20 family protein